MKRIGAISLAFSMTAFALAAQSIPVTRANVDATGIQANAFSVAAGSELLSADGRWIVFISGANNLVPFDTNQSDDIFLKNTVTGTIERVNLGVGGSQAPIGSNSDDPSISGDASVVAFSCTAPLDPSDVNGLNDVYIRDTQTATTERVSVSYIPGQDPNGKSGGSALSFDGRYVAFDSMATNLVPNDTNNFIDVFLYDRGTHMTERISVDSQGQQSNDWSSVRGMSADGRFVLFASSATNFVPKDTNGAIDLFVRDRVLGTTTRVSVDGGGNEANGSSNFGNISADGTVVVFQSGATNLVVKDVNYTFDIFAKDLLTGNVELISVGVFGQGNYLSLYPVVSQHGRYVVFASGADNLVPNDTNQAADIFVRDRLLGTTTLLSEGPNGVQGNGHSQIPGVDALGLHVLFNSNASNLVANDTNNNPDVFLRDRKHDPDFVVDK
jgi:hypothetical protein